MRADARQFAEWRGNAALHDGIDLIVGHHAHVVRGVEIAGNSLIFYGLGNFLHHGTADMTAKGICRDYGLMARVHLKKAADGKLVCAPSKPSPSPTRTSVRAGSPAIRAPRASTRSTISMTTSAARAASLHAAGRWHGLYCLPGADKDGGSIGALCNSLRLPRRSRQPLATPIANSCAR